MGGCCLQRDLPEMESSSRQTNKPQPQIVKSATVNGVKIQVVKYDITDEEVDAIVSTANTHLSHGGGTAEAIKHKGGVHISIESSKIIQARGPLPKGEVVVTRGGELSAKYVLHAIGPIYNKENG